MNQFSKNNLKVALTGGAGDLGQLLCYQFLDRGDLPRVIDIQKSGSDFSAYDTQPGYVCASITDRKALTEAFADADVIIHIAAWHGIHEFRKERDAYEFWDLNVTGTFNVFQIAHELGIRNIVFISSTSIDDRFGVYGHTKVLGEEIARTYARRQGMNVITLRPRAFIPHWNRSVYTTYVEWAKWFWSGAVHINDVAQAVVLSIELLTSGKNLDAPLFLPVDGAYQYNNHDLEFWDKDGPGSTFKRYYADYLDLVLHHGLDPALKPKKLDISETIEQICYQPKFSLRTLLEELAQFGEAGPPKSKGNNLKGSIKNRTAT